MKRKRKLKKISREIIMHRVGEAYHDLNSSYYSGLLPCEKEMVKFYIHLYGIIIGILFRCKYEPH